MRNRRGQIKATRTFVAAAGAAQAELAAGERLLAKLVARAFAADHPELFPRHGQDSPGRALPPRRMSLSTTRGRAPGFLENGEDNGRDNPDG